MFQIDFDVCEEIFGNNIGLTLLVRFEPYSNLALVEKKSSKVHMNFAAPWYTIFRFMPKLVFFITFLKNCFLLLGMRNQHFENLK